jgi:hypothetical protein
MTTSENFFETLDQPLEEDLLADELFAGCGHSLPEDEEDEETENKTPEEEKVPYVVRKGYSNVPSLPDQYRREGLWERGPSQVKIFNLSDPESLSSYNEMLAKTHPEDSPRIIIEANGPVFSDKTGGFMVFFSYREILYRNLIVK